MDLPHEEKTAMPAAASSPSSHPATRRAFFGLALAGAAALGGCVVVPYGHGRGRGGYERDGGDDDDGPVVGVPPPPPQVEVVPVAPGPAYVWIGGYWAWRLGRHVWIGGRWGLPPARGHAWVPGGWYRAGPGWRYRGGRWGRG
jgi:hypothetical protein